MLACCMLNSVYGTVLIGVVGHKFSFTRTDMECQRTKNLRAVRAAPISTACRDGSHPSEATWPRAASENEGTQVLGPIFEHNITGKKQFEIQERCNQLRLTWLYTCG